MSAEAPWPYVTTPTCVLESEIWKLETTLFMKFFSSSNSFSLRSEEASTANTRSVGVSHNASSVKEKDQKVCFIRPVLSYA